MAKQVIGSSIQLIASKFCLKIIQIIHPFHKDVHPITLVSCKVSHDDLWTRDPLFPLLVRRTSVSEIAAWPFSKSSQRPLKWIAIAVFLQFLWPVFWVLTAVPQPTHKARYQYPVMHTYRLFSFYLPCCPLPKDTVAIPHEVDKTKTAHSRCFTCLWLCRNNFHLKRGQVSLVHKFMDQLKWTYRSYLKYNLLVLSSWRESEVRHIRLQIFGPAWFCPKGVMMMSSMTNPSGILKGMCTIHNDLCRVVHYFWYCFLMLDAPHSIKHSVLCWSY